MKAIPEPGRIVLEIQNAPGQEAFRQPLTHWADSQMAEKPLEPEAPKKGAVKTIAVSAVTATLGIWGI